jgi:protein-S-isoprenylcysteine O-methyltransferase Ste14
MGAMSDVVKPVLFEAAVLVGFVAWALLALWVDAFLGLRTILAWPPYNYLGIVPFLVGVALRFWASSTIFNAGKGTPLYTRPTKALVTTGPYRLIRNPLYLGGLLIFLGIIVTIPSLFLAILGLIGLPIIYTGIAREEKGLEGRFGEDYRRYKQNVPGWIPRIKRSTPT